MRQLFIFIALLFFCGNQLKAQYNTGRFGSMGGGGGSSKMQRDTSRHDHEPDTLTLTYRHLGEPTDFVIDSSVTDFQLNFLKVPATYTTLGNSGSAARNLIYSPLMKPGFDAGFHSYDVYANTHEGARFYYTTRPYTELQYLVGSKQEQVIQVTHTQNRTGRFNFAFDYRKVNAPGYFRSQNTNHDTYRLTARYQSKNKRANTYFSFYYNKLNGGENGGVRNDSFLTNPNYTQRKTIPVFLGNTSSQSYGFFGTTIPVKTQYQETGLLIQQQYDWGKGDSIHVNDTTDIYRFDPVFRVQYTFNYQNNNYQFIDTSPDTTFYTTHYNLAFIPNDTISAKHVWKMISNDLSLIQFPMRGNLGHFINIGARFESITGTFMDADINFTNLALHGEYRNKTRNKKWDFSAKGEFYLVGQNMGDYSVAGMLRRHLSDLLGDMKLSFTNVNREPSYVYKYFNSSRDTWYNSNLAKENTTQLQFATDNKKLQYSLAVNYFLFTNYTYFKDYYHSDQYTSLFNLLQVVFSKKITVKPFAWYIDLAFQQLHGNAPLNVPAFWTRNRFAFEKKLYTNLNLMTGIEVRYNTGYYADDYSPLTGQFIYQNKQKITYNFPDLAAFANFRIKSFSAYVRAENLNTFFSKNNYTAPLYPYNNFDVRVGLRWWFIN
ncbi:putative beta-barrel porin [Chitinophaga niastensis]|uniref:Putative beta-barrel porin n=1 Tax=Chitinophaga niastensis TaxID=536980 RepID=A0A2P8H8Z0_CHINA|nr:putative porin [Chitinophaga niastensis]PSL42650.1 putative beta-barrel porin [Chitinophaga niastensis]